MLGPCNSIILLLLTKMPLKKSNNLQTRISPNFKISNAPLGVPLWSKRTVQSSIPDDKIEEKGSGNPFLSNEETKKKTKNTVKNCGTFINRSYKMHQDWNISIVPVRMLSLHQNTQNLVTITFASFVEEIKRNENLNWETWPNCLRKFTIADESAKTVQLCYFYEVDFKLPAFKNMDAIRCCGLLQRQPFDSVPVFVVFKIRRYINF